MTPRRCPVAGAEEIQTALLGQPCVPISHLQMDFVVAGAAKRHEVGAVVCAATRNGQDMMDLFHQGQAAFFQTLLTERML